MTKADRRRRRYGRQVLGDCVFHQQSEQSRQYLSSAFGDMPYRQAGGLSRQFTNPLSAAFGIRPIFGEGPKGQRREARYDEQLQSAMQDQGPLGNYIRQAQQFLPSVMGQAQSAGSRVASLAPQLFDQLRSQVSGSLGQLGDITQSARGGTAMAESGLRAAQEQVNQQMSPIAQQALYQNALRGSLEGMAPQAAARGLGDAGSQMGREETIGRDLAAQFAQNQFANQQQALMGQQQALGGLQGALGTQAGLLPMGAQLTGMLQDALPGLQQAMAAGYQMPMDALNAVFQQIAAAQNPQLALLGQTAPQVLTASSGHGYGGILGG